MTELAQHTTDIKQLEWQAKKAVAFARLHAACFKKQVTKQELARIQGEAAHRIKEKNRKRSVAMQAIKLDDPLELAGRCVRGIKVHRDDMAMVLYSMYRKNDENAFKRLFIEDAVWQPADTADLCKMKKKEWNRLKRLPYEEIMIKNEICLLQTWFWEDNPHEEDVELHSYLNVKKLFEETYCQLMNPGGYIRMYTNDGPHMQMLTRAQIMDQCGALYYYCQADNGRLQRRSFIRCWLKDTEKRILCHIETNQFV